MSGTTFEAKTGRKPRFVVLLRGVNVGKRNRVPMAEFKRLLEQLGCTDVKTLLNSGNAVFASPTASGPSLAASVAAGLERELGVTTPVIVKSATELGTIVGSAPVVPDVSEHARCLVVFGPDAQALQALVPLQGLAQPPERFWVSDHAAYLVCPGGLLDSPTAKALLGRAGRGVTTRNWATVLKIAALLGRA